MAMVWEMLEWPGGVGLRWTRVSVLEGLVRLSEGIMYGLGWGKNSRGWEDGSDIGGREEKR